MRSTDAGGSFFASLLSQERFNARLRNEAIIPHSNVIHDKRPLPVYRTELARSGPRKQIRIKRPPNPLISYLRWYAGVRGANVMSQISLTFPDGAKREVPAGTTGLDVAKSISPSLAKRTVAMSLDGKLADLASPISADAAIKFLARTDPETLELIRHDAAHVMAEAVQELYPGTQATIGPVIANGFSYRLD